jgi:hypothetical protein
MITVRTRNPIRTVNANVKPNGSFSYAGGDDEKGKDDKKAKEKKAKTGFFSKARRTERKDDRIKTRTERREKRRAKYGVRPLNPFTQGGKQFWKNNLPKLKKKANGKFEKTLPDGTQQEIEAANALIVATEAAKKAAAEAAAKKAAADDAAKKAALSKNATDIAAAEAAKIAAEEAAKKAAEEAAKQVVVDKKDVDPNQKVVLDANGQPVQTVADADTEKALDENGNEQTYKKSDVVDENSKEAKKPMSTLVKVGLGVGAAAVLGVIIYLIVRPKK